MAGLDPAIQGVTDGRLTLQASSASRHLRIP